MADLEEGSQEAFDLSKYVGIVRRRHWYLLVPLFFGWLLVWGGSWFLPSVYKSATTIIIEQPTVSKDLVPSNVNDDLQGRLQSITQQILSRSRLLRIIESLNLYPQNKARLSPDDLVDRMRKDIDIELVRVPGSQELSSFNVSFSAGDPYTAQKVTSELTNLFINENLEIQDVESKETTQFFESQLEDARKNLGDQEEKIRQFKAQHVSDLPGQLQSNLAILGGLQSQMQGEQDGLNRAKQQNTYYQSLLSQYRSFQRPAKTSTGSTSMGLTALDQELEKLQAQLADLMSRGYTDRHPDVRKLKDQIAETQQMKQQALAEVKKPDVSASSDAQDAVDPRDATAMAELKSQLQANQLEITNHEQSIAALNARIADYQARLGQEPVREQQLADLSRGYDQSKANYDDLLKKKNASELSTNLTERQQGEHFRVLDPPSLPVKPDFPDHLKLCAVGFAGGLALGLALVVVVEFMDDRLHSEKDLKALVPVSVIVEIPSIASPKELRRQQNSLKLAWVAATLVFAIILAGAAISYLRG